ncbi:cupredoxin family copper-binding protein [Streptomyces sp. S.PB5]|uniref:cupredoxin domain-containing protein n=1 Tax=Streptomyces sp. S.PB5 TaxID=3020844 RepID=UPI0025B03766|nr:cupredoxin family copper-binding protein [Streptomyces sp. S.PB5]MDN3023026.1 cupredoxin family copper-binding protein [Streptomyces sp. S.PB5]
MTRTKEDGVRRPRPPAGNRALLVAGLGAALAAVLSLGLLQASAGSGTSSAASDTAAGAAQAPVAAAAESPQAAAAAPDHQVDIMNNKFGDGKQLVVEVGQTVRWTNHDSVPHTVTTTKGPKKFDSGTLDQGDSWSYTFTAAGTYEYYCAVHPDMVASVKVVEPSDGGGTTPAPTATPTATPTGTPTSTPTTAPTATPTAAPTGGSGDGGSGDGGSGDGGSGDGGDEQCASVQDVLLPILQHLNAAHLERSPGQQVQDALALDTYIKTHTVWIESILAPVASGGGAVADDTLSVLLAHINGAHLEESLGQQVSDLLNLDSYVKMHTVWAEHLLAPTESFVTGSC